MWTTSAPLIAAMSTSRSGLANTVFWRCARRLPIGTTSSGTQNISGPSHRLPGRVTRFATRDHAHRVPARDEAGSEPHRRYGGSVVVDIERVDDQRDDHFRAAAPRVVRAGPPGRPTTCGHPDPTMISALLATLSPGSTLRGHWRPWSADRATATDAPSVRIVPAMAATRAPVSGVQGRRERGPQGPGGRSRARRAITE